ncbi:MAG: response regulator transcription factor [Bacteroidales bacterium]|nr:response regulator transcription factor [Bacteroidales bacterium]
MKIKCLAVDDEPFALKQIVSYIEQTPFLDLVKSCGNAIEALEFIKKEHVDLIFLDINMPEMTGMELAKSLDSKTMVIFTTAYEEFALESYEVEAIDYILKPISRDDFMRAARKAADRKMPKGLETVKTDEFFVKSDGKIIRISLEEITYIESMSEYVRIHFDEGKSIMTLMSMKNLDSTLPQKDFMRVHRSYIVNLNKVQTIERNRIVFNKETYIPVSDQYKDAFKEFVEKRFL